MKKQVFKNGSMYLLAIAFIFAGTTLSAQEAEKTLEKSYDVSKGFTLGIENKYGEINIANWDQDEVSVVVTITVKTKSQSSSDKLLDAIEIDVSESNDEVNFETSISDVKISGNKKMQIVYEVKAPAYLNANLSQKYGKIYVQELNGEVSVEAKYSDLDAVSLERADDGWNSIEIAYGAATIDKAGRLGVELKYGSLNVSDSRQLEIESAYSKFELGTVNHLDMESKYDKVLMDEMLGSMSIEGGYTSVKLGKIGDDFEAISAELAYGNLKGELPSNPSFVIEASASYGNITLPVDVNVKKEKHSVSANGTVGSGNGKIFAKTKYGSIIFE